MNSDKKRSIVLLFIIAGRVFQEPLLNFLSNDNAKVVNVLYGEGSVKKSTSLLEAFGFVPEQHKVIITCLLSRDNADVVLCKLVKKFNFDKPNTGIAFTVNVDALSF